MKKICAALLLTAIVPFSTFAISLSELQDNPSKYEVVTQQQNFTVYADTDTIKPSTSIPPYYYSIECTYYEVNYSDNYIYEVPSAFSYDSHRNRDVIFQLALQEPMYNMVNRMNMEILKDPGMQYATHNRKYFYTNGDLIGSLPDTTYQKCVMKTAPFYAANYAFNKCYNTWFTYE